MERQWKFSVGAKVALRNSRHFDAPFVWGVIEKRYMKKEVPWYTLVMGDGTIAQEAEPYVYTLEQTRGTQ